LSGRAPGAGATICSRPGYVGFVTIRLFWDDPYAAQADARVTAVDGRDIELDRTIFFAFSGGQESDAGTIGGQRLNVGDLAHIVIDWERRYRLMRLHFAAELVLEMVCAALPGVERIGAHIAEDKARIDFAWPQSVARALPAIAERVAGIVAANLPIRSAYSDAATGRRFWEVEGVARVPCGGTHLRRTGEVGPLTLRRRNVGKGKERVEIRLDR
jgi:Ser-tRNA(Ala) deacylase AlaX